MAQLDTALMFDMLLNRQDPNVDLPVEYIPLITVRAALGQGTIWVTRRVVYPAVHPPFPTGLQMGIWANLT